MAKQRITALWKNLGSNIRVSGVLWLLAFLLLPGRVTGAGLDWLAGQNNPDGSYARPADIATAYQASAETLRTFQFFSHSPAGNAYSYLDNAASSDTESLSRRLIARVANGQDTTPLRAELLARQNADGGFGDLPGYESTVLDTSFALQVLSQPGQGDSSIASAGIGYLLTQQQATGVWHGSDGAPSVYVTALALLALEQYRQSYPLSGPIARAADFLLAQADARGAMGEDFETALALLAVQPVTQDESRFQNSLNYLQAAQATDGSWGEDVYITALALRALVPPTAAQSDFGSIHGIVVDGQTGLGLAGMAVQLSGTQSGTQSTQSNGQFSFPRLSAGAYSLQIGASLNTTVQLAAGQNLDLGALRIFQDNVTRIQGTVTDAETGQALAGVEITASGIAEPVYTGNDGSYLISGAVPGEVLFQANKPGYLVASVSATLSAGNTLVFSPALTPDTVSIQGMVVDGQTQTPLMGVSILVNGAQLAQTSADGTYQISGVPSGPLGLAAEYSGYDSAYGTLQVTANATVTFSPKLYPVGVQPEPAKAMMSGTVMDKVSAQPVAGVQVGFMGITAMTDATGHFELAQLPEGQGELLFTHPEYSDKQMYVSLIGPVNYELGEVELIPLDYRPHAGFKGVVMDASNNMPLSGVTITVQFGDSTYPLSSDSEGRFEFSGEIRALEGEVQFVIAHYATFSMHTLLTENQILDVGQVRLRPEEIKVLLPDLAIENVSPLGVTTDPRTLEVSGSLTVGIKNDGLVDASMPFSLLAFHDVNLNGTYEADSDVALGEALMESALAIGESREVSITVAGTVPFRDAPITVWVDSRQAVAELEEGNNLVSTASLCDIKPEIGGFAPVLKWRYPQGVSHTPIVGPLVDTNKDGRVDKNDTPTVIVAIYNYLAALDGRTGKEIWRNSNSFNGSATPALGDIDGDGLPEVVATLSNKVIAINNDGTTKWVSDRFYNFYGNSGIIISDMDGDGYSEIIESNIVLNYDGTLRWIGSGLGVRTPVAVDLDEDGLKEVLMGKDVYHADGSLYWEFTRNSTGYYISHMPAIGNFDDDPYPEIVDVGYLKLSMFEHDGTLKWGPISLSDAYNGGPATIADMDGDGIADIGVAGQSYYRVFNHDGSEKWKTRISDSSGITGSSVFDLNGDGQAEVLYQDEGYLYVFNGVDGSILFKQRHGSATWIEYPTVADVDNDGHADFLVPGNSLEVYQDVNNSWVRARGIWNQHAYCIDNVNDDGSIPRQEAPSWLTHNTFRLNGVPNATGTPDPTAGHPRVLDNGHGQPYSLIARIGNAGAAPAASLKVGFYAGDPATGGTLLGSVTLPGLAPGAYQDARLDGLATLPTGEIYALADPDNTVGECNETNNSVHLNVDGLSLPPQLSASLTTDAPEYGAQAPVSIAYTVANLASLPADAEVVVSILDAAPRSLSLSKRSTGSGTALVAEVARQPITQLPGGGSADFTAVWNTGATLAGDYQVIVQVFDAQGQALAEAAAPFVITSDHGLSLRTTTDRAEYHTTDTVTIENLLRNLSSNLLTEEISLLVRIDGPDGLTYSLSLAAGQLAPGAQQDVMTAYALRDAAPGEYTITVSAYSADGAPLATDSTAFRVVNRLDLSITGETGVAAAEIYQGETQYCTDIVRNQGGEDVADLPVRQLLAGLDSGDALNTTDSLLDLPVGAEAFLDRAIDTAPLSGGHYACVLQANWDDAWHTLGWAAFRLKGAPCGIYAVHNASTLVLSAAEASSAQGEREKDSQLLFVETQSGTVTPLGPVYPDYNLEGLAFNPKGSGLYAVTAQPQSVLYEVNHLSGELSLIGTVQDVAGKPFESVTGLAFRADGTLWGYADKGEKQRRGIIQIDPQTGIAEIRQADTLNIESLAWSGNTLWLFKNKELYSWTPGGKIEKQHQLNALPGNIEGVDSLADGRLILSIHHGGHLNLYVIDPAQGRIDRQRGFSSGIYDNLEAVAVPWHCSDMNWPE